VITITGTSDHDRVEPPITIPGMRILIEQWPWRSQMSEEQIAWTKALEHKRMELIQALARRDFAEADRLKETIEEMERHARSRGWRLKEH
jgi:hypothetical protein